MNKIFAEIIAGCIPHKPTRNRWRGIFRYGLKNAVKLKKQIHQSKSIPEYYLSVCAIAKDEGDYLKEWVEWHRKVGVDKFYIYDNGSTDKTREVLEPYISSGLVEYIWFPGYRMQIAAYDDCLEKHRFDTFWMAFIDIDEFIVPVRDKSIPDFLKGFEKYPVVEINWLVYGSSGAVEKSDKPVMTRFHCHSVGNHYLNRFVKSIVNTRRVFNMIGCHEASRINGKAVDSHGNIIKKHFKEREPLHDIIHINHYAVKSRQEFLEKQNRGRASGRQRNVPDDYFSRFDLNDVDDL